MWRRRRTRGRRVGGEEEGDEEDEEEEVEGRRTLTSASAKLGVQSAGRSRRQWKCA